MFTAEWAIANPRAGHPLGQAAPTIATLMTGIDHIVPKGPSFAGSYTDSTGTTYAAKSFFALLHQQLGYSKELLPPFGISRSTINPQSSPSATIRR